MVLIAGAGRPAVHSRLSSLTRPCVPPGIQPGRIARRSGRGAARTAIGERVPTRPARTPFLPEFSAPCGRPPASGRLGEVFGVLPLDDLPRSRRPREQTERIEEYPALQAAHARPSEPVSDLQDPR